MSPPPPPLGRSRRRGGRTGRAFDPALGDGELIDVRSQFAQGRWTRARSLLVATGSDWDRRGHRILALAAVPSAAGWAADWLLAEPDSADAAAHFHRIGPHATEVPWSYAGRDPYPAFVAARTLALGAP